MASKTMRVIESLYAPGFGMAGPTCLTIGNFDGMHLGHRKLINDVVNTASKEKIQGGLMTFDPHPVKVLNPSKQLKSLFDVSDRLEVAKELGLDFAVVEPFSRALSELSPAEFFRKLLVEKLKVKNLFVGHDFTFGKNRAGTLEVLAALCRENDVELNVAPAVKFGNEVISSSLVRKSVAEGEMKKVKGLLGRYYYLKGVVEKGAGRGRKIGFPTANLYTAAELLPRTGIYVTSFEVRGKIHRSVTNVGTNPTFTDPLRHPVQVETYVLDFNEDIYGEAVKVFFHAYVRPELKFDSVDALIEAIKKDVAFAEEFDWKNA